MIAAYISAAMVALSGSNLAVTWTSKRVQFTSRDMQRRRTISASGPEHTIIPPMADFPKATVPHFHPTYPKTPHALKMFPHSSILLAKAVDWSCRTSVAFGVLLVSVTQSTAASMIV
jgi:hypothetical protein